MHYYMQTTDAEPISIYKELKDLSIQRAKFIQARVRAIGFDEIAMQEFGEPERFYKKCGIDAPRCGPAIDGFKGGIRTYVSSHYYHCYTLNRRGAKALLDKILDGAPVIPDEAKHTKEGMPLRKCISSVFAKRLGLADNVFGGGKIFYAETYCLHNQTLLIAQIPFDYDKNPVVIPDGWTEIAERVLLDEIKKHNDALK